MANTSGKKPVERDGQISAIKDPVTGATIFYNNSCTMVRTSNELGTPDRTQVGRGTDSPRREAAIRELGIGNSAIGSIITVSYGRVKVPGVIIVADVDGGYLHCVWSFGFGEISAWNDVYMNDDDITNIDGASHVQTRNGTAVQTQTDVLGLYGDQTHPGLTLYSCMFRLSRAVFGGSLDITADIDGRKVYEFRTGEPGYGTWIYTDNLVLIAYDILTADWPWTSEIDPADIDYDSWEALADYADVQISSGSGTDGRHRYRGTFDNRDAWAAADEVLRHGHMHVAVVGDKFYLWREGDVTPNSGLIDKWFETPKCSSAEPGTITSEVNVVYRSFIDDDSRNVVASLASGPNEYVYEEIAMNGFRDAFMANRWGLQYLKLKREIDAVTGVTGPEAAQLIPGQIQPMDLQNGFGEVNVRILKVPVEVEKGKYTINGRIVVGNVDDDTNSDDDEDNDWVPPWTPVVANLPADVDQEFGYSGDWQNYSELPDPDDLTGWTESNIDMLLDGSGDFTTIRSKAQATGSVQYGTNWASYGGVPARILVTFLYRTNASYVHNSSLTLDVQLFGYDGGPPLVLDLLWLANVAPENDTDHEWKLFVAIVNTVPGYSWHYLEFNATNMDFPDDNIIDVKKMFFVPWGGNPNLAISQRFTWTEHVNAADSIIDYQIWREMADDTRLATAWATPQGNDELEFTVVSGAGLIGSPVQVGGQYFLRAHGKENVFTDIDVDTQSVQELGIYGLMNSIYDMDETDMAAGTVVTTAGGGVTKEHQTGTANSLRDIETITAASDTLDAENWTVLCDCTSNAITINLPAAADHPGREYRITKIDSSASWPVTVDPDGSETMSGLSSKILTYQWDTLVITSDGASAWIIQ